MAATVDVREGNGGSPTWTIVTTPRFCTMDAYNPGTANPLVKPDAGSNYSFKKSFRLYTGATPATTAINNVLFYTDGTNDWTGIDVQVKLETTYAQATGTTGTTGTQMTGGTDAFSWSGPGDAITVTQTMGDVAPTVANSPITDIVAMQAVVGTTAVTPGAAQTFTFRYDET